MERNTVTEIKKLQIGDRFYRANDGKKHMYTKVQAKPLKNKYTMLVHAATKDGEKGVFYLKPDTQVVFMRHTQLADA